jgi:SAM-dependent methyltransferase
MNLKALGWHWERFARTDPLWAIASLPGKRNGAWDVDEFFATGRAEVAEVFAYLDRLGLGRQRRTALDFGCGVGRLTQAVAERYEQVVGVDISPTMLRLARRYNRHGGRCRYVVNRRQHLAVLEGMRFDLVLTNIVLQHMEPELALGYIREFLWFLAPGGVAVFQLPFESLIPTTTVAETPLPRRRLVDGALRLLGRPAAPAAVMELYVVPRDVVIEIVRANGARVVDVVEDGAAGGGHRSARYCVVRD